MDDALNALLFYADTALLPPLLQRGGYWAALKQDDLSLAHAIEAEALFQAGLALGLELGRL